MGCSWIFLFSKQVVKQFRVPTRTTTGATSRISIGSCHVKITNISETALTFSRLVRKNNGQSVS